jgi:hypothetical protein
MLTGIGENQKIKAINAHKEKSAGVVSRTNLSEHVNGYRLPIISTGGPLASHVITGCCTLT